jgi:hypothetical protein
MLPVNVVTTLVKLQVWPPIERAKVALPVVDGVPVIVYVKVPLPLTKFPGARVAVRPVTPAELIL